MGIKVFSLLAVLCVGGTFVMWNSASETVEPEITIQTKDWPVVRVTVQNRSDEELRIWEDTNSWGYGRISFALVSREGELINVRRKPQDFTENSPTWISIAPKKEYQFQVDLSDGWWTVTTEKDAAICIAGILHSGRSPESLKHKVWTSTSVSQWVQFE